MKPQAYANRAGLGPTLILLVLAACADEAPPAGSSPEQATAESAQAALPQTRISMADCATPDQGKVHFRLGPSVLVVQAGAIRDVIPANVTPDATAQDLTRELQAQAADGRGCPGKPIEASMLMLEQDLGDPLLRGTIALLRTPPERIVAGFAEMTRNLQRNPPENCQQLSSDLLGCVGRESRGNAATDVLYVVTTDSTQNFASGGPVAARCVLKEGKIDGCNLVDEIPGGLTFDAVLAPGTYSTAGLRNARDTAEAQIDAMRR